MAKSHLILKIAISSFDHAEVDENRNERFAARAAHAVVGTHIARLPRRVRE
jgi:hypothetical protein